MVVCVVRNSLDEVKSNINKIKDECYKINIYPRDIHTAAILYPNVIYSDYTEEERQQRHFLNGSIDQVGKDLQEVKKAGIDHAPNKFGRKLLAMRISSFNTLLVWNLYNL